MAIDSDPPTDLILENASEEDEWCPVCQDAVWMRLIAAYRQGACWVIFCAGCGRAFKKKWTML